MGLSLGHIIVLLLVIFVLFGAGKLPQVFGDLGKGIKNLRDELQKDEKNTVATIAELREVKQESRTRRKK